MKKIILHNDKGDFIEIHKQKHSIVFGVVMGALYLLLAITEFARCKWQIGCDDIVISFLFLNIALLVGCENKFYNFLANCRQTPETESEENENENKDDINEQQ